MDEEQKGKGTISLRLADTGEVRFALVAEVFSLVDVDLVATRRIESHSGLP